MTGSRKNSTIRVLRAILDRMKKAGVRVIFDRINVFEALPAIQGSAMLCWVVRAVFEGLFFRVFCHVSGMCVYALGRRGKAKSKSYIKLVKFEGPIITKGPFCIQCGLGGS